MEIIIVLETIRTTSMIRNSGSLIRDLRNMKKSNTMAPSQSKEVIGSMKQLKKVRSSQQINLTAFMENKNQKIKNIDEKLEVHQSEIDKNNQIIEELSNNFANLKVLLDKEKESTINEEKKTKLLKEQIERTNKILRTKNLKIQQCSKRIAELEKQVQNAKGVSAKNDQYARTISSLRSRTSSLEEALSEYKRDLQEKQRELSKAKEKLAQLESSKIKQEEFNIEIMTKDALIHNLKMSINQMHAEKEKYGSLNQEKDQQMEKLKVQFFNLKQSKLKLQRNIKTLEQKNIHCEEKLNKFQSDQKQSSSKLKMQENQQNRLKNQLQEIKHKCDEINAKLEERIKQNHKKETKIQKLNQKIKQLQNVMGETYKQKQKMKISQNKVDLLKKKLTTLESVYNTMTPQIQCPFGHELNNPVTIIPCGHNYCLGCKKGYAKECMQCSGKLKIQAVYRNQLMDDIIGMVAGIKTVIDILK